MTNTMNNNLRFLLHKKIVRALQNNDSVKSSTVSGQLSLNLVRFSRELFFALPLKTKQYDITEVVPELQKDECDDYIKKVELSKNGQSLFFYLDKSRYVKGIIERFQNGVHAPDYTYEKPNNVIVEYSSPNIAKPFHVGHLRSTMLGNYISNLDSFFNNNVKRINYLGDWGTQFGFVQLGLSLTKVSEETLKKDPINTLYNAYVHANKLAQEDPSITDKAREIFRKLESGDKNSLAEWETFRKYTIDELTRTYNRIGVEFDEYEWESMYSVDKISSVISEMEKSNLLFTEEGKTVIKLNETRNIPIIKSDGSTLYITRDIAAAINRYEKYNFDAMHYVVDNTQIDHFNNLFFILNKMKLPWADRLKHVKFGKIKGMSTRKGTAVFLQDLLDEMRLVMKENQIKSPTTKVNMDYDHPSTEVLGLSAVIVNDLKHKRNQDYDFKWDKILDIAGYTGVKLQYTHCRLVSLEKNSGASIAPECNPELMREPSAENLIYHLGKFDEFLIKSHQELEPNILVMYLFDLSYFINVFLKYLKLKSQPSEIADQRLLLLNSAKNVLARSMRLLGITPLEEM